MKKLLLAFSILLAIHNASAQQKDNIFLSTELNRTFGNATPNKTYGLSLAYNRLLSNTNFGLGASVEFIDIRTQKLGGIMPAIDLRYYSRFGKSTLIPLAQVGYNFYQFNYQDATSAKYQLNGGLGYTFGLGYSYSLTQKGGGLFTALKFRGMQYKVTDGALPARTWTKEQLNLSIGWRF
jgi:hypothetical protein